MNLSEMLTPSARHVDGAAVIPASMKKGSALGLGALLLLTTSGAALAQSDDESAAENSLNDVVVVTASKREETLLEAPVAVTPLLENELRDAGVVGLQDLNSIAPSLHVRHTGSVGATLFSIRGVSNADWFEFSNPPVVTYVDGVVIGRPESLGTIIHDIERIEVLRGPQGTLYGRNSTGGNVNILTAKPIQEFDASADFSYGNYNEVQARGMLNVPVSDTLALRGSFALRKNDGIYDTADSTIRNYGAPDELSVRLSSLWQPTDNFDWHLVLDGYRTMGTPALSIVTDPNGVPLDGRGVYDPRPVDNTHEPDMDGETLAVRSRMNWGVSESTTLSYIAGYQDVEINPQTLLGFIPYYRDTPVQSMSHEVNIAFEAPRLHAIMGANYLHQTYGSNAAALIPGVLLAFVTSEITTESWGIFGQATYDLTDSLSVIGGVRYSSDDVRIADATQSFCFDTSGFDLAVTPLRSLLDIQLDLPSMDPSCVTLGSVSVAGAMEGRTQDEEVTWRAGLSYDFSDDASAYATVSTGYKTGGLNLGGGLTADTAGYRPESVTSYEVGYKTQLLDGRLNLNTALYYMDYEDIQVTQLLDLGGGNFANLTQNAAGAENYGAEIEWTWDVVDNGTFSGFFNYIHATYTDFPNALDDQTNATFDATGNFLPYAAEFSLRVSYEHIFPLANGGVITPRASLYWQSESFIRALNLPVDRIPSYTKTDLAVGYTDPSGRWTVEGFVQNLENEIVRNGAWVFVGAYNSSYDAPRTYGGRVSFNY